MTLCPKGRLSRRQRRFLTDIPDFYPVIPAKAGIRRAAAKPAAFVGGHDAPNRGDGASATDHAHDAQLVGERCRIYGEREVVGLAQRQNPSHQRREAGVDVYLVRRGRGAVGAVVEPLAESPPDAGKAMRFPSPRARFRANFPLQALYGRGIGRGYCAQTRFCSLAI